MKEAMRCHPGVSFPLERVVPEGGTVLCGSHLDAGTIVGINPAVMHHDQTIFGEDAAKFRPERWIESDEKDIKNMDRHLMTVRMIFSMSPFSPRKECHTNHSSGVVWVRFTNVHWEKHIHHGNGQVGTTNNPPFRNRMGVG